MHPHGCFGAYVTKYIEQRIQLKTLFTLFWWTKFLFIAIFWISRKVDGVLCQNMTRSIYCGNEMHWINRVNNYNGEILINFHFIQLQWIEWEIWVRDMQDSERLDQRIPLPTYLNALNMVYLGRNNIQQVRKRKLGTLGSCFLYSLCIYAWIHVVPCTINSILSIFTFKVDIHLICQTFYFNVTLNFDGDVSGGLKGSCWCNSFHSVTAQFFLSSKTP